MSEPRRRFRFLREIAQGGFGKVYLAEMITGDNFSSIVAIKVLHGKWIDNDEVVMRSRDEARLLGRLRHRNIVRVEDLTAIQGQCAIVMEYLQGVDLKNVCTVLTEEGKPFPRQAMFEVIGAIAAALDAAFNHRPLQGGEPLRVIHRDIKPSNVMITIEGDVKVLDFGTARANFDQREAKTQALAFGSAAYMSPERLMGEEDRPAADVFSLGVTLYELLTLDNFGKIHIRPERFEKAIAERMAGLDLSALPPAQHERFRTFVASMLAYEHEDRPTAKGVVEEMESFGEQVRDGGLKRFAREAVSQMIEATVPEQDPNDPLTGSLIYEDSGGFVASRGGADASMIGGIGQVSGGTAARSGSRSDVSAIRAPQGPAPITGPHPRETISGVASRVSGSVSGSTSKGFGVPPGGTSGVFVAAAPAGTPPAGEASPDASAARSAGAVDLPLGRPGIPPTPPALHTVTPRGGHSDPPNGARFESAQRTGAAPPVSSAESSGGGIGKVLIGLVFLGIVALVGVGGAIFLMRPTEIAAPPVAGGGAAERPDGPKLTSGAAEMDFTPNVQGKGGAILQVPTGAVEVTVTSSTTEFRQEWDGTKNLRLRDLEPGVLRGKVKPQGEQSLLADFKVEGGTTCVFIFNPTGGGSWDKSECR